MNDSLPQTSHPLTASETVSCDQCQAEHSLSDMLVERPYKTANAPQGHKDITEAGLLCPSCGAWVHVSFKSDKTIRALESVTRSRHLMNKDRTTRSQRAWRRAQRKLQGLTDELNAALRPEAGVVSPTLLLAENPEA